MFRPGCILVAFALICFSSPLVAMDPPVVSEPIQWRSDYDAARQEASQKRRPILLLIGSETCSLCRKLEAFTLKDNRIVRFLNDKLVTVKIDGNREFGLTQALKIRAYPTLILADQNGQILQMQEGYQDARSLEAVMRKNFDPMPQPIVNNTNQTLLLIAKQDFTGGRFDRCLEMCDRIMEDSENAEEIKECEILLAAIIEKSPRIRDVLTQREEQLARSELKMSRLLEKNGKLTDARELLDTLIQHQPKSIAATEARLERMRQGGILQALPAKWSKP
jgi:thioredoxin-related protein